ncbi:gliding motility protein GldM [Flavobacterium sp. MAH-1]|uniref:Gliding motility protein GldM n=1 Tax=Flavobacterium agri TaxID=2743471 RepID=A0A7Y8Y3E9_9FLAO|nr:gliding motility protein GldM [Flavobacterium agri]NUY81777.1 gliding motility protein GldM [Flavobacterium agri]NYA71801.1 gliding motility protein GldM [Flavobacterium agri]
MASGKLTPRQKMINLMYLVFIAMLALNMSKEVLSAFGLMNEKFEAANISSTETNTGMLAALEKKASEDAHFTQAASEAKRVSEISNQFYTYLEGLKKDATEGVEVNPETKKLPYEAMDKGDKIDERWFEGDGYSPKGKQIVDAFAKYLADMKAVIGNNTKLSGVQEEITAKFNTADVKDGEGVTKKYLDYHFKGFPSIASLTKISAFQNDVRKAEADTYAILLGKAAVETASMKNYTALVVLDKNAYFQGEKVTGKVVLGRYDQNTKPTAFKGPGKIQNGQAVIDMTAGSVGEQKIAGEFTFLEDGKPVPLKFEGKYVVVPRPSGANISADKMNVVYRGLPNPMTISVAGVADSDVKASAPGLSSSGKGKYNLNPGGGTEVVVNVNAKLPDGKSVTDKKVFRIKNIPGPQGAIGGIVGDTKGAKSRLEVSQVSAKLEDFLYDLNFRVTQFTFKVPGQAAVVVNGDRVNAQCKAALARASRGDQVTISDIKTVIEGAPNITTKKCSPVIYEIQ